LKRGPAATGYGAAIRDGFEYLLANHSSVFTIGQGLWSPWYVGNSMTDLDSQFGRERVIAKSFFLIFIYMWLRWSLPRLRVDHLLALEWKGLLPISMANLALASFLVALGWVLP
jgi:NADH:ubiquinone oxidoreductase subunit H